MPYLVRNATLGDMGEMIRLERLSSTAAHWTKQQYQGLFGDSVPTRAVLIAIEAKAHGISGFLIARHLFAEWELENIVVAEEARRKGIGTQLMQAFLRHAIQTNSESVFLEVRESNAAARKLYEECAFREAGRRKSYYTNPLEDAVLYAKDLRLG